MNVQTPDWRKRWNLKQACLRQFGIWPEPATKFAYVMMTRVLGPGEKLYDSDNFIYVCKAIRDSLTNRCQHWTGGWRGGGNYIIDDDPSHAVFTYGQDATRRHEGPRIEIVIRYERDMCGTSVSEGRESDDGTHTN